MTATKMIYEMGRIPNRARLFAKAPDEKGTEMNQLLRRIWVACVFILGLLFISCRAETQGPNCVPVAIAGMDQVISFGEEAYLDGDQSYDPDGDTPRFDWQILSLPANSKATLVSASQSNSSLLADVPGLYVIGLVVTDSGRAKSPPDAVTIRMDRCTGDDTSSDTDGDGVCNNLDTDDDGDSWSDAEETACGSDPLQVASVPNDTDGDTVCDPQDQCPTDSSKTAPGQCGCGISDADSDGDTVPNCMDTNESLDDSFSAAGEFLYQSPAGSDNALDAVTIPDGSIFITGYMSNGSDSDLLLMKLTSQGVLDTTFGGTGIITRHNIAGGNGSDQGTSIELATDGDLLIGGMSENAGGDLKGILWKISTDGVDDASFGTAGTYQLDVGQPLDSDYGYIAKYDSSTGNILTVGQFFQGNVNFIRMHRIIANGSGLDTNFSTDGELIIPIYRCFAGELQSLPTGKIMVAGFCRGDRWEATSWLLNSDGSLDSNYGDPALYHDTLAGGSAAGGEDRWDLAVPHADDRLVLAGFGKNEIGLRRLVIARVNLSNGSFDHSFGGGDGVWTEEILGNKLEGVTDIIVY